LTYDDICDALLAKKMIIADNGKYELSKSLGTAQEAIEAVENELKNLIGEPEITSGPELETEDSNLPAGAENDPNAPWNQNANYTNPKEPKKMVLKVVAFNRDMVILKDAEGNLYEFYYEHLDKNDFFEYAEVEYTSVGRDEDGFPEYEYDEDFEIDKNTVERYVNDNLANLSKGTGIEAYEDGVDLIKIDEPLKNELLQMYAHDRNVQQVLGSIEENYDDWHAGFNLALDRMKKNMSTPRVSKGPEGETEEERIARLKDAIAKKRAESDKWTKEIGIGETTGAASSGAFTPSFSSPAITREMPVDSNKINVPVVKETLSAAGAGHFQYDANALPGISRDGSFKKQKKTKAEEKTQWSDGAFVDFNDCVKLNNKPAGSGCSKGAIDNVVKLRKTKGNINAPSLNEALKLQYDKENNKLVVISDLEGRAASQETFKNKDVLKKNGFVWSNNNWTIPADKLDVAKSTLTLINKAEYIINTLEDLEAAVDSSDSDKKSMLKAKLELYINDLANATDEKALSAEIRRYLTFFSKFHDYSFFNRILIYIQKPDATKVASYKKWQEKHRQVKKGAKGISVLAPIISKDKSVPDDASMGMGELNRDKDVKGFRAVNVFDISDTEPMGPEGEVPPTPQWFGDNTPSETADELFGYVSEVASDLGIKITSSDASGGEKGYAAGDHINISSGVEGVGRLSTMIHEIAHELMHFKKSSIFYQDDEVRGSSALKELQAESVSYVVLKHYGLPVSHHTTYLALWKANKDKIQSNLEVISKVSQFIIDKIDEEAERANKESKKLGS
jgi:hypothetical protein